ncbi:hypothetical protein FHETE_11444, partial [Fusarium heterosporum]
MTLKSFVTKYIHLPRKQHKEDEKSKLSPTKPAMNSIPTTPSPVRKTSIRKRSSTQRDKTYTPAATGGGSYPVGDIYGGASGYGVGDDSGHRDRGHRGWGGVEDGMGGGAISGGDGGGSSGGHHSGGHHSSDGGGSSGGGGYSGDSGGGSGGGDGGG